jgi:homocysteine S-methyltransferase
MSEIPLQERSGLGKALVEGPVISVELDPPRGLDIGPLVDGVERLVHGGVRFVNIADGPRASARMSPSALALVLRDKGVEPIVHITTRDRNLLGIQADLLGMHTVGIRNLLVITGDPSKLGDYPDATTVYDLDSIGLLRLISDLNQGIEPSGRSIGSQTAFVKGCGAEPGALDFEKEVHRLFEKVDAGADFVMTQPVFDYETMERFLDAVKGIDVPLLMGVWPLASYRNAEFLNNEVPGVHIPAEVMQRMREAGKGAAARREGIAIAREMVDAFRERIQGIYVMPPFGRLDTALELLDGIEL